MLVLADINGFHHQLKDAKNEFGFSYVLRDDLVCHMNRGVAVRICAVANIGIAQGKDSIPWHRHIIEDNDRVHFFKTGTERVIKGDLP